MRYRQQVSSWHVDRSDSSNNLTFLNRQFDIGGAERQLIELLKHIDKRRFRVTVVTFYNNGTLQPEVEAIEGIHQINLNKRGRYDIIPFLWRLWCAARASRPHIIHGYLDLANVLALLMGRLLGTGVVWGILSSNMPSGQYGWALRMSLYLQEILGRFADLIIHNSHTGLRYYASRGIPSARMIVIPNGIDIRRFCHNGDARRRIRAEWGIQNDQWLVGLVGRLDPAKDHSTFIRAVALFIRDIQEVRFVCVGDGPTHYHEDLKKLSRDLNVAEYLIWAGSRSDMPDVYNAFDIATSSSTSEGLPYALGEAMSCGIPCVVTDVGDSAWLVGDTGIVVPPGDPHALMEGWKEMFGKLDAGLPLGNMARERIIQEFSADKLAERTMEALEDLVKGQ
ncbi:MAG: glycosyltransferase [Anaerolineae bacterium]|nr:glycosyltransferase [Anaerolineae bacterium]